MLFGGLLLIGLSLGFLLAFAVGKLGEWQGNREIDRKFGKDFGR